MFCIWAAEERRYTTLTVLAVLAALTKEEVGLALAVLGVWMFVRGTGRRYGPLLAVASVAWVAFAMKVVIPHFNEGRASVGVLRTRYRTRLALGGRAVRRGVRPPQLPRRAPDPAAVPAARWRRCWPPGPCPRSLINVLADYFPQYSIEFQYVAVIVPFVVAASILGLARLLRRRPPGADGARSPGTPGG